MKRGRKELAAGETEAEAIFLTNGFDEKKHEAVLDTVTGLWSVYHKRRQSDKSIKRAISRVSREPYSNGYGKERRPIVVTLHPHELIETRLKGTRRRHSITWDALHSYLVRRDALAAMRAKQSERTARRKLRKGGKNNR